MKRPNILILYTDQQRWDALGANGNDEIITPNLDALAARGVKLQPAFCPKSSMHAQPRQYAFRASIPRRLASRTWACLCRKI